jgi:endoglucanase
MVYLNMRIREDVRQIAGFGYDHIRLPIDKEQMWDEKGNKETRAFELLHEAVGWALEFDLRLIVDLPIIRSHYINDTAQLCLGA